MRDPGCEKDRDEQDPTDQDDHVHESTPNRSPRRGGRPGLLHFGAGYPRRLCPAWDAGWLGWPDADDAV
jgi:hypothetical protein